MNEVNGAAKNKKQNNITSRVRSSFLSAIEKYGMDTLMSSHGAVVAGFSGGADSICMLYLLNEYCTEHEIKLIAAHVNHMIRGEDADSDESFCRDFAERHGIEIQVKKADVPALAKEMGKGTEETARLVRYGFFDELAEKYGADSNRTQRKRQRGNRDFQYASRMRNTRARRHTSCSRRKIHPSAD